MTEEMPPLSRHDVEVRLGTGSQRTARNPYFRSLTLLATFLLVLGVVLLLSGEPSTGGILLGIGFSALLAVLVTGAITWQIRQAGGRQG
jgi:hypothetical protein